VRRNDQLDPGGVLSNDGPENGWGVETMSTSDLILLERWTAQRDAEALRELIVRHSGMVYGTCRRILRNEAEAEDVTQECFVKLIQAGDSVRTSFAGWLHRSATHRALDRLRAQKRRIARENAYARTQAEDAEKGDSAKRNEWAELQPVIDEAIAELDEDLRYPIVQHFLEGQTHREVAESLGIGRSAVTLRIHQGIDVLRENLRHRGVVVEANGLMVLMGARMLEVAPASLRASLGKMALSGGGSYRPDAAGAPEPAPAGAAGMSLALKAGVVCLLLLGAGFLLWPSRSGGIKAKNVPAIEQNDVGVSVVLEGTAEPDPGADSAAMGTDSHEVRAQTVAEFLRLAKAALALKEEIPAPQGPLVGSITGTTVDRNGEPVADATVAASGEHFGGAGTSDENGAFTIEIRGNAENNSGEPLFMVTANHLRYGTASELRVPLNKSGLELELKAGGFVAGTVIDAETGDPIEAYEIRISRQRNPVEGEMGSGNTWTAVADPEGRFVLPTEFDTTQLEARAKHYGLTAETIFVAQGEALEDVVIALEPGFDVVGIVRDAATREPVAGARVSVPSGEIRQWWGIRDEDFDAITGPDGRFRIEGKATGAFINILAWHATYPPEFVLNVTPNPREDVEVLLSKGGRFTGRVLRNGEPIAGLRIHAGLLFGQPHLPSITPADQLAYYSLAYTDADGKFDYAALPYGRYFIRIIDPDPNAPLADRYLGRFWIDFENGATVDRVFEIGAFSRIEGTLHGVADPSQTVVALYDARYPTEMMYMTGEKHGSNGPDADGRYHFGPVPAGNYVVRAMVQGETFEPIEETVTVGSGQIIDLPLVFQPAALGGEAQ
jgi:RNA polymerase sigma factor (sigma-70 family)